MKLLASLLLLLGIATTAFAQSNTTIGGRKDTDPGVWVPAKIDANGNFYMKLINPAQGQFDFRPGLISATIVNNVDAGIQGSLWTNRDSTGAIDIRGFNRAVFLCYPSAGVTPGGHAQADSCMGQILAVQVRSHPFAVADSQNTYRHLTKHPRGTAAPLSQFDTLGTFAELFKFTAQGHVSVLSTPYPDEFLVPVGNIAGPNRGFVLWAGVLNSPDAQVFSPFMSIRMRTIASYHNNGSGAAVSSTGATAQSVRYRVDGVFWYE